MKFINFHTHKANSTVDIEILQFDMAVDKSLPDTVCSVGLHPGNINAIGLDMELLYSLAQSNQVALVGETGLDTRIPVSQSIQEKIFAMHIDVSEEVSKPLLIHCVRSYNELIRIKKKRKPQMPWFIHGYNNRMEITHELLKNDFYFSFGKALLHEESHAAMLIKKLPLTRFFLETDDDSVMIETLYKQAAGYRKIEISELTIALYENYKKISLVK